MKDFIEVADGKLKPSLMSEQIFKTNKASIGITPIPLKKRDSHLVELTIDAKDNPPTVTARDDPKTDRTIDIAYDYISRLETDLKGKNNEHKFLKSRLERALEKKNHPSVGSWQNNNSEDRRDDEFEGGLYQTKQ